MKNKNSKLGKAMATAMIASRFVDISYLNHAAEKGAVISKLRMAGATFKQIQEIDDESKTYDCSNIRVFIYLADKFLDNKSSK